MVRLLQGAIACSGGASQTARGLQAHEECKSFLPPTVAVRVPVLQLLLR